jgi:TrwC relaxase
MMTVRRFLAGSGYVHVASGLESADAAELAQFLGGVDLLFTPPAVVVRAWLSAVGVAERTRIQRCHRDAVDDAFGWARIRIATARDPDGTVARIAPQRLHTSRVEHADDDGPHRGLHTHLLIAGRMRDGADGPWTVLDLRQVHFVAPAMSARYDSFVTAQARWRDRP